MLFKTYQTAFNETSFLDDPAILREVIVPMTELAKVGIDNTQAVLSLIFKYGQNDIQPVPERYSLSVGDIISLSEENEWWLVSPVGFKKLDNAELVEFMELEPHYRSLGYHKPR